MKAFIFGVIFVVLLAVGGYFGFQYLSKSSETATQTYKTEAITRTGVLQKSTTTEGDFTHIILSGGKSYGVSSYSVSLDEYVGKTVEATGQNSGTTLYIDTITEVQ